MLVGTTGLILIRISHRSYRVSSYAELILIIDVCSFGTPVGVIELILIQDLYLYYRTYAYSSDTRVPVGTTEITQIQEYP